MKHYANVIITPVPLVHSFLPQGLAQVLPTPGLYVSLMTQGPDTCQTCILSAMSPCPPPGQEAHSLVPHTQVATCPETRAHSHSPALHLHPAGGQQRPAQSEPHTDTERGMCRIPWMAFNKALKLVSCLPCPITSPFPPQPSLPRVHMFSG